MSTTASRITRKPGRCGGNACIRETRIPVWSLIESSRLGNTDAILLAAYPGLTLADLIAAREYAAAHPTEIERAIWENTAGMVEHDGVGVPIELVWRGRQLGLSDQDIRHAFLPPLSQEALTSVLAQLEEKP